MIGNKHADQCQIDCFYEIIRFTSHCHKFNFKSADEFGRKPALYYLSCHIFLVLLFSLLYFKMASINHRIMPGRFCTFSSHVFINPLPAFHFIAMAASVSGTSSLLTQIIKSSEIDPFTYISLAFGVGIYISTTIANNLFATKS